jgi:hypothetical protein
MNASAIIELPWPSSELAGHNRGHWSSKARIVATHRSWAFHATREVRPTVPETGDIHVHICFTPPHNRGDRANMPIMLKPYLDGIAEAMGVNDKRFLPSYEFLPARKPGKVTVTL